MDPKKIAHRKSGVTLCFKKPDGSPLVGGNVELRQVRHEFLFGCGGFDAVDFAGGKREGAPEPDEKQKASQKELLDRIFALCNYATLPFYWGRYEPEEGFPDEKRTIAAAKYFAERGIVTKGHPLCWHTVCAPWLLKYTNAEIVKKQLDRIRRDVGVFRGLIDKWDVINEAVIMPVFDRYDNAVTRICKDLGRVPLIKELFAAAKEANSGASFLINDFDLSEEYAILIDACLQAGVPIDTIGLQTHQHQGYRGADWLGKTLERFSRFGLPLHFTENTIVSGQLMSAHIVDLNDYQVPEWPSTSEGEERQARELVEMYEILFAHPSVEAITNWDPRDGKWLGAPAGLLRKDNSPKPAYDALMEKIRGEWWTRASAKTDEQGEVGFEGFRGNYKAEIAGKAIPFTLDGKQPKLELTVFV
jgi:GH35 family endo-1,4-beta-xylanase